VPIPRATCPECHATLSSPNGFTLGQVIICPKCDTYFDVTAPKPVAAAPAQPTAKPAAKKPAVVVEDENDPPRPKKKAAVRVDEEDEDDRPRKKPRRRDEDDEDNRPRSKKKKKSVESGSYRTSPIRFIILGILVLIMVILGVMLYLKKKAEQENSAQPDRIGWTA
jgi:hypothetical protein